VITCSGPVPEDGAADQHPDAHREQQHPDARKQHGSVAASSVARVRRRRVRRPLRALEGPRRSDARERPAAPRARLSALQAVALVISEERFAAPAARRAVCSEGWGGDLLGRHGVRWVAPAREARADCGGTALGGAPMPILPNGSIAS
jgi:hypothetical protein